MGPAFFSKDAPGPKIAGTDPRPPHKKAQIDAARGRATGSPGVDRRADEVRREAYAADRFVPLPDRALAIDPDGGGDGFKVKSLLETRCVACHGKAVAGELSLETYEKIEKNGRGSQTSEVGPRLGKGRGTHQPRQADAIDTRAPLELRGAVLADRVSVRVYVVPDRAAMPDRAMGADRGRRGCVALVAGAIVRSMGAVFRDGIIGTGGAAGVGLILQVALSLLNMYGVKGKFVVLLLFAAAGVRAWQLYINKVKPGLEESRGRSQPPPNPTTASRQERGYTTEPFAFLRVLQSGQRSDGKEYAVMEVPFLKDKEGGWCGRSSTKTRPSSPRR